MHSFLKAIRLFFRDSLTACRRHPLALLPVFLINLTFFFAAAFLIREALTGFWDNEILSRLSRGTGAPLPLTLVHAIGGRPLVKLSIPFILYLAFSAAFSLATIFTGPILTRLSRIIDPHDPVVEGKTGVKPFFSTFFYQIKEEILMLALNINISAGLFLLGAALLHGVLPAQIAFYLVMPPIYGLYALSYPGLRRHIGYQSMATRALCIPGAFAGFSSAAALGYFLIFFLASRIPHDTLPLLLLLAFGALWRTFAATAGTLFARRHQTPLLKPPSSAAPLFRRIAATLSLALAAVVILSGYQGLRGMHSRLGLLECRYSVRDLAPSLSLAGASLRAVLVIRNPTATTISLPHTTFDLSLNGTRIAGVRMERRTLLPKGVIRLPITASAESGPTLLALIQAVQKGSLSPTITGAIDLPFWFGEIKLYVIRI